ncbi:MAG: hypothetical protein Q9160_005269 [Pyrenula sp. 1 TL-2023]
MDQSPISRVSGFALAASLANLEGCAGLTGQSLWTLQLKHKEVLPEIRYLLEDVKILQSLLLSIENLSKLNTDIELPPELQSIWQRTEKSLLTFLESLQKLVTQFQQELDGSLISRNHLLARLRHAGSDGAIVDLRGTLKSHIQTLSFLDMLLAQRHLKTSHISFSTHTDEIAEKISDDFAFCKDEIRTINDVLMEMRNPSNDESAETRRFTNQATPNSADTDLNMHTTVHRAKRRRRILWRWSLYEFPIGTLTTEALLTEEESEDTKQKLQVTFNFKPPSWLMNPRIYTIYTSTCVEDQGPQTFVPQQSTIHTPLYWIWAYVHINDREMARDYPFYPRIGIPVSKDDFYHFVRNIGQHFDPQETFELPKMDRWWVSALIYGVPHFKAFILSHFASFRSHLSTSKVSPRILDFFEYSQVVEEILGSPPQEQLNFLGFLCVYGTGKMLLPFRHYDWHLGGRRNSFLRAATLGHNSETFNFLVEVLRGSGALKQTLDQELLDQFLGSPFHHGDDSFLNKLLSNMPPSVFQTRAGLQSLSAASMLSAQIPMDLLAHEEPQRLAGRDEVALHLIHGIQTERLSNTDALTKAVDWAVDDLLDALLGYQSYLPDPSSAIFNALEQAERNYFLAHPRSVILCNSKSPQYPLIKTRRFVEETDDTICCLLLVKALRKLQAFPEPRFTKLMFEIGKKVTTLMEDTLNGDSKFSPGSRGAILVETVLGNHGKTRSLNNDHPPAEKAPESSPEPPERSPLSSISIVSRWSKTLKPLTTSIKQLTVSATAFAACTIGRLRGRMNPLDIGLLVFGMFALLAGLVEYAFWQVLISTARIPKPSNAALSMIGVIALAYVCVAFWDRVAELYDYGCRLVLVEDSQTVGTIVV